MKEPNKLKKKRIITDIKFNKLVVSLMDISLPSVEIKKGDVFFLKDAYIEDGQIILGIELDDKIEEAGFAHKKKSLNYEDIKDFVNQVTLPYVEGANYYIS